MQRSSYAEIWEESNMTKRRNPWHRLKQSQFKLCQSWNRSRLNERLWASFTVCPAVSVVLCPGGCAHRRRTPQARLVCVHVGSSVFSPFLPIWWWRRGASKMPSSFKTIQIGLPRVQGCSDPGCLRRWRGTIWWGLSRFGGRFRSGRGKVLRGSSRCWSVRRERFHRDVWPYGSFRPPER